MIKIEKKLFLKNEYQPKFLNLWKRNSRVMREHRPSNHKEIKANLKLEINNINPRYNYKLFSNAMRKYLYNININIMIQ